MALTVVGLRQAVLRKVEGGKPQERPFTTTITSSPGSGTLTVDVADGDAFRGQDHIEFDDGDQALVISVATNTLTISRGLNNTTPASHTSGERIRKNPVHTIADIDAAIDDIIDELRPDIYLLVEGSVTYDPSTTWYPVSAGDIYKMISLYTKRANVDHPMAVEHWKFLDSVDDTEFTEDQGLVIAPSLAIASGDSIFYLAKSQYKNVVELPDRYEGMMANGAAYIVMGSANAVRTMDPGKYTDRTVQPGTIGRDSIWFLREYIRLRDRHNTDLRNREDDMPKSRIARRISRYRP